MDKVWAFIKKWLWAIVLGLISLLALGRKPKWVKLKEAEIKARDDEISKAESKSEEALGDYGGVKKKHDEAIKEAAEPKDSPAFTDPDSAADFIDKILGGR